jgi:hypothetical protein
MTCHPYMRRVFYIIIHTSLYMSEDTRITDELVDLLNEETTADNFESVIQKYRLDIPQELYHEALVEMDGQEIWGVSEPTILRGQRFLVYSHDFGWALVDPARWMFEVMKYNERGADVIEALRLMLIKAVESNY